MYFSNIRDRDCPPYIIAEAGINHNGSLQTAKNLVKIADESGADAVKFQKRELKETYVEDLVEIPRKARWEPFGV